MERKTLSVHDGSRWAAISAAVGENHTVIVILDCAIPSSPVPVHVTIRPGARLAYSELDDALASWTPPRSCPPVTSETLRAVGLGELVTTWVTQNLESPESNSLDEATEGGKTLAEVLDWVLDFPWPPGGFGTYRRRLDLRSALTKAAASVYYQAAVRAGDTSPTLTVARILSLTDSQARDLIARARATGFLSEGSQGRSGGIANQAAIDLINNVIAYRRELDA